MTTQKKGHRLRCERLAAMLVIALLAGICCFLPAGSEAEETVDLQDQSVIYLTGYVKWDGSDPETRLPVVRLVHVAEDGTAVSLQEGVDYDLALERPSEEAGYTITITGRNSYSGTLVKEGIFTEGIPETRGSWELLRLTAASGEDSEFFGMEGDISGFCYVTKCRRTDANLKAASLEDLQDELDEYADQHPSWEAMEITRILPGTFEGCTALQEVDLYYSDFPAYLFINCPKLRKVSLWNSESGFRKGEAGPMILGPTENDPIQILCDDSDYYWWEDSEEDEDVLTISDYCDKYGYELIDGADVVTKGDWTYKVYEDDEEAIVVEYLGSAKKVSVPAQFSYNGETMDVVEIQPNAFRNKPDLEEIDLGELSPVAPLCSNCPKIRKISTLWPEDPDEPLENPLVEGDQPVQPGQSRPAGELIFQTFPNLTVDYNEETDEPIMVEEYCAKYGYLHETYDIRDLSPRIFNNDSRSVIIGGTSTLSVGVLQSALDDSYISLEAFGDGYTPFSWKASVVGEAADTVNVQLAHVSGEERLTVTGSLAEPTTIKISCRVRTPVGSTVSVSTELTLLPRFVTETNTWLTRGVERYMPFAMNVYEDEVEIEQEGEGGEGEGEGGADPYEDYDIYEDTISDLEVETISVSAFPDAVTCEYTLDEVGQGVAEIEGSLIRTKDNAVEGQKLTVSAVFKYNQQTYELSAPMEILDPEEYPEELQDLEFQENDILWVTCLKGSGMPELISTIQGLYPELASHIEFVEADDGEEIDATDTEARYRYYQDWVESEFLTRDRFESSDLIAWPAYMIKEQLGSDAAVDLAGLGFDSFPAKAYPFTKDQAVVSEEGSEVLYALPYRVDPGGFLYDKAVARALLGTDDPAEVQKKIGSWQDFIRIGEDLRLGKSGAASGDYYLLSTKKGLAEAAMPAAGMVNDNWDELNTGDRVTTWLSLERKLAEYDLVAPQGTQGQSLGRFVTAAEFPDPDPEKYGLVRGPAAFAGAAGEYVTATAIHDNERINALKSFVLRSITENERVLEMSQRMGVDRLNNSEHIAETNAAWDVLMRDEEYLPQTQDVISRLVQERLASGYTIDQWKKKTGAQKTFGVSLDRLLTVTENEFGQTEFPYAGNKIRMIEEGELPEEYQHPGIRMMNKIDLGSGDHWLFDPTDPDTPGEEIAAVLTGSDGQLLYCKTLDWAFQTLSGQEELDADLRIRLFRDGESSGLWNITKPVTLDLNGHSLSAAEQAGADEAPEALLSVGSGGELTITDESDHQGTIAGSETTAAVKASGGLCIEGGRIEGHILVDPDAVAKLKVTGGSFDQTAFEDLLRLIGSREYMQMKGNEDTWEFMADLIAKAAKEQEGFVDTFAKEIANILATQDANSSLLKEALSKLTPEQAKAGLTDLAMVLYQGQDRDPITPTDAAAALAAVDSSIPAIPAAKIGSTVNVKKKSIIVKIPAVKGALNYRLRYRSKGAGAWKYQWTGGKTQTIVSRLAKNGCYEVQVTAFGKNRQGRWVCGNWSGGIYRYVASTSHKAVKSGKKKVKVTIKKYKNASGYQIIYSANKKMTKAKVKTVRSPKKTKVTIKRLKKGKPLYVKVRPFKKVAGKIYYGETRKVVKVK